MKFKSVVTAILILVGFHPSSAFANDKPTIESFYFSPNDTDIEIGSAKIVFELVVSHPKGIENTSTIVTLANKKGDTFATYLTRTDSPIDNDLIKVTFKGSIELPKNVEQGVYEISVAPISNNPKAGYKFNTGIITPGKIRNLIGGENALLVRRNGDLNLVYETFVGPSYETNLATAFLDPQKFNSSTVPIFRVNEIFNPNLFFELRVPELKLLVETSTLRVCGVVNNNLHFLAEGNCTFSISTGKNSNYSAKSIVRNVTILPARIKPNLYVGSIQNQNSKDLPKNIPLTWVYSESGVYVLPKSKTPSVCLESGFFVRILSGGTCTLTYQSEETSSHLSSNIYEVSFEVTRDPQTVAFTLPSTANVSNRPVALAATATGGGAITYSTASPGICSITGSTLNLLGNGNCVVTATQAGTSTFAPASTTATVVLSGAAVSNRKTITCVKGKSTKRVSGVNPKCPKGFKVRR